MSPSIRNWPYAAKAVIQHSWDVNHLNVWVTFRHPMDQTVKPADGLWLVEADTVPKAISASTWQDAYTMLLTVPNVNALPDEVTVEYDGPSSLLITTWDKQWEPWGPLLSINIPFNWEDVIYIDVVNKRVGIGGAPTAQRFEILSNDGSDRIKIYHDNTDAHIRWDDGYLILQTDEGVNTQTIVKITGKGTENARLYVYNQAGDNYVFFNPHISRGYIGFAGPTISDMTFQHLGDISIRCFSECTEGDTAPLYIFGFRAGDARRVLRITVGINAPDQVSFEGVSNYRFSGNVIAIGAISSGTSTFSTGPAPQDDVDVSGVNTLFIDAGATAITIGGFVGGVDGQLLNIVIIDPANNVTLEHAEGGGNQDILLHAGADETIDSHYGGWTLVCHAGTDWYDASHAKHV